MHRLYKNSDRYKFIEELKSKKTYYVVCIDIINFRGINDKYGFFKGDILLSEILRYISNLSTNNTKLSVCRYERDIIMIMTETINEDDITQLINKVILNKYKYDINFRVGYKRIDNKVELDKFLDSIIYVIKNKKYKANKEIDYTFELSLDIEKYIAIKDDIMNNNLENFYLVYQPKILNDNKEIDSCEVLSRWNHPQIGQSNPSEFLPIVRSLNKEIEFDLMVFEKACLETSELSGIINKFSINISIKSFTSYEFVDHIYKITSYYNINTKNITLEIVEDICENNHLSISKNINKLVELGYKISIDDFGTGYSSYCRLAELNFSEVKIPREFLMLEKDKNMKKNKEILLGIVRLCKSLNYKIVIEGVETAENVKLAELLNIDYIQGYYYSRPLSKIKYTEFIKKYKKSFEL